MLFAVQRDGQDHVREHVGDRTPTRDDPVDREHDAIEEGEDGVYAECERLIGAEESHRLLLRAHAFPEVRAAKHFDGQGTCRTAHEALASAMRIVPPRTVQTES